MNIVVNGEELSFEKELTIEELLSYLKIEDKVMAAAIDMNIVKKEKWRSFNIKDKSKVELLHFVGGG